MPCPLIISPSCQCRSCAGKGGYKRIAPPASHSKSGAGHVSRIAKQLARPDAVYLPTINGTPFQGFIMERILYKALDNVILNASDLATELRDAQQKETGFLGCLISVLTPVPGDDLTPFVTQIDTCAAKVGAN